MSVAYGSSVTQPCQCPDKEPFCTTCNTHCDKKMDAQCVVYHLMEPTAINKLTCLGLPNGVTLEQFMEAVDDAICNGIDVTPIIYTVDTLSVDLSGDGTVGTPLQADVIISPNAGNALTLLSNGLYATGGDLPDNICSSIPTTFITDVQQNNGANQSNYDFLIHGTAGCQRVSPPLGFAVAGSNRKSAFGNIEFFSTLTLANNSAVSGETVLLYQNTTESLTAKNGVGYYGVGLISINDFTLGGSNATSLQNLIISGTLTAGGGTSIATCVNVRVTGGATIGGSCRWDGGRFLDNSTVLVLSGNSITTNIYSEKRINVSQSAKLSNFDIYFTASTGRGLYIDVYGDTYDCIVSRGIVTTTALGANEYGMYVISQAGAKVTVSDIVCNSPTSHAIYLHSGNHSIGATLIARGLVGKSVSRHGIEVVSTQIEPFGGDNAAAIIDGCVGYSESSAGIFTINGNLKHCTGYSQTGAGIEIGGSEFAGANLYIMECIAESANYYGLLAHRDVYISGGTFVSRRNDSAGNPIRIDTVSQYDPGGIRRNWIVNVTTVATFPTAYAISGVSGLFLKCMNNTFVSQYAAIAGGIDPIISLVAGSTDSYGNRK